MLHVEIYIYIYIYHTHIHTEIIYIYIYVYMCIWRERERERDTEIVCRRLRLRESNNAIATAQGRLVDTVRGKHVVKLDASPCFVQPYVAEAMSVVVDVGLTSAKMVSVEAKNWTSLLPH